MQKRKGGYRGFVERLANRMNLGMRAKLIIIFITVKIIPLLLVAVIAWTQIVRLGETLRDIAAEDSMIALNNSAVENIERMTTDTANAVAAFLYQRDADIRFLAQLTPDEQVYRAFGQSKRGNLIESGNWALSPDGSRWEPAPDDAPATDEPPSTGGGVSTNSENNDKDGFHYRASDAFDYRSAPLYDEISFIGLDGMEQIKVVAPDSTKTRYPMNPALRDVSRRENTYVKAETHFEQLKALKPGEIYVSDVIGAYVGSNYIGMYTPPVVAKAAEDRGYDIEYDPEAQAYAGQENPGGRRFEGIVRWATPVVGEGGRIVGYVSFALNHDHIMEFVDHITPMNERYSRMPSAFEGNYAFIWDYKCRSICHPRHNSIVGYDPETGEPQIPWLESSIYDAWQASGNPSWVDFTKDIPKFDNQSRQKKPAPALTKAGLVGLDGRYLNNAPQCTGWMDLTKDGGSGSFYILWSELYKLTTAGAIPYYTGQYAPSEANGYSRRGFGIVTIGAEMYDFTKPAEITREKLSGAISENLSGASMTLMAITVVFILLLIGIAIWLASWLTGSITRLIQGISRFRAGERQFRFRARNKDEFGTLADSFDEMADSIVDSVKHALAITDMNQRVIYMNEQGLGYCKKTLEQIVGTDYRETSVYPANSKYYPITALQQGREAEIFYNEEFERYLKGTARYFLNKDGVRIGYIVESQDVTDMVMERMKIEEQRTLLDQIFSASPDLIWYEDMRGEYLAVNPRFAAIAGKSADALIGKTGEEVLPKAVAESLVINDKRAMASTTPQYCEEHIVFADGHEEALDSVRTPIFDANGLLVALLGFARNVSTRVSVENELRETQLRLERAVNDANAANEHKGNFLARMSHEIRTPMNAIIGLTNIVLKKLGDQDGLDKETGEVRAHVKQIEVSSQHLLGLLNDILDISKIEAGKIELSEEPVELYKLAHAVEGIIKPRCDEKQIRFVTRFERFEPSTFLSDSLRLRQVLINLLGNAVKFTPKQGQIDFAIRRKDRKDGAALVEFSIKDTGIGIERDRIANIFQPFEQADRSITRKYGGTGLGLAISRNIVQMYGGDIEVISEVGQGSEFRFRIWLKEAESELPQGAEVMDITGKFVGRRALLVDDVEINRMIVMALLEDSGLVIDEAADGVEAVKMFEASGVGEYGIIFMDVQMPKMDGYGATREIRKLDRADAATVPILALTANAFKDDMDRAAHSGMNGHLTKPIEMEKLAEMLFRFLQ